MSSEVIYTTNYTYCPIDLTDGEYRLNITTINGAGTGILNSNTTMYKIGKVQLNISKKICLFTDHIFNVSYLSNMTYCQNKKWTNFFRIDVSHHMIFQYVT